MKLKEINQPEGIIHTHIYIHIYLFIYLFIRELEGTIFKYTMHTNSFLIST
jgi:hypothetical protein